MRLASWRRCSRSTMRGRRRRPGPPRSCSIRSCATRCRRLARVRALHAELDAHGVTLRLRTPTIVRPEERKRLDKWLDLGLPVLTGHLGLLAELSAAGARRAGRLRRQRASTRTQRLDSLRTRGAAAHRQRRAHRRGDRAARGPVGGRGLRRAGLGPTRGDDARALRAVGGVRSRRPPPVATCACRSTPTSRSPIRRATPSPWPPTPTAAIACCTRARSTGSEFLPGALGARRARLPAGVQRARRSGGGRDGGVSRRAGRAGARRGTGPHAPRAPSWAAPSRADTSHGRSDGESIPPRGHRK